MSPQHIAKFFTANNSDFNNAIKDGDLNKAERIANAVLQAVLENTTTDPTELSKVMSYLIWIVFCTIVSKLSFHLDYE